MLDQIEILEPVLYCLKLTFVPFLEFLLNLENVLLKFDQLLGVFRLQSDSLKTGLDLFEELLAVLYHALVSPADDTLPVVVHSCLENLPELSKVNFD